MSGQNKGGQDGRAAGGGGYSKRGKPRPGTGGFRKDRLEGKGPTPPAYMRPGHPAQPAAAKAARGAGRPAPGPAAKAARGAGRPARGQRGSERPGENRDRPEYSREGTPGPRGSGEGP